MDAPTKHGTRRTDRQLIRPTLYPTADVTQRYTNMIRRYTDTDNTGFPAVPQLNSTEDDPQCQREVLEETVWSHRLTTEEQ